jgi:hypothetical protein
MVNNLYKARVTDLIAKAKEKEKIKTYSQFCKTKDAKENALTKEEIIHYTSMQEGEVK